MMVRLAIVGVCATVLATGGAIHAGTPMEGARGICRDGNSRLVGALDRVYRRGKFRIIYTTHGEHALASTVDRNGNGIPDQVEDAATQLVVASRIYSDIIGLDHPLDMPRYASVRSIDVFVLNMERGNGLAYDEAINYRLAFDGPEGRCTLRIDLRNSLANQNVTPAHELFHLHQYAYSMFKARWFLEGTARWAEYALRAGTGPQQPLPETGEAIQARLFSQTYQAGGLWNRLAGIADPVGRIPLPNDLAGATYLDGSAVVHDDALHGAGFMKALLEELGSESARVASRRGWDRYNWAEVDQKSPEHDEEMLQAVSRALSRSAAGETPHDARELQAFLKAGSEMAPPDRLSAVR